MVVQGVQCGSFVGHVRQRLAQVRPLPPGNDYKLLSDGRLCSDNERLSSSSVFAVVNGEDALAERIRMLLDQVMTDGLEKVVDRLAEISLSDAAEMEQVTKILIGTVLSDPHNCELYAKMVYLLLRRYPSVIQTEGDEPASFRRTFLEACQNEFDACIASVELSAQETDGLGSQEIFLEQTRRKSRLLTIVKFAGHLFVGNVKFIALVAQQLVGHQREPGRFMSDELRSECVCDLLEAVGTKLNKRRDGKALVRKLVTWLLNRRASLSTSLQLHIEGLAALSANDE